MAGCAICGETDDLTRRCNYCGTEVCSSHTLPEKHNCPSTRAANDAGKHFESAFDATLGDSSDSASESPKAMDKSKIRTYGTEEAVEDLDSSPPVQTKSNDDKNIDKELNKIKRRQRWNAIVGTVTDPLNRARRWTASKLPGRGNSTRSTGRGSSSVLSSLLSARFLLVVLISVATVGQLGVVGIPGFPVDTSPAESFLEDTEGAVANATDEETRRSDSEASDSSSDGSGLFDNDLNRTQIEYLVHEEINERRQDRGLQPLKFNPHLRNIARNHSRDMGEQGYFSHTSPDGDSMEDRYEEYGYMCEVPMSGNRYATGAENIAYTYANENVLRDNGESVYYSNEKELARGLVNQWMNSTGHRKNILRDYWQKEGIGVYIIEVDGKTRVYATQNFC
ncbi:CAP domain-containing protein [Halorussus pelagicus]|uniref:CAP domain-containing protein n=1 Tax=Halorussus pelagicus TaxID=2505977 RepID=UPI000FFBB621|nr:CAP domain-containing protein [Halorussus pelagicus]